MEGASALFFIFICTILGTRTQVRHFAKSSVDVTLMSCMEACTLLHLLPLL